MKLSVLCLVLVWTVVIADEPDIDINHADIDT